MVCFQTYADKRRVVRFSEKKILKANTLAAGWHKAVNPAGNRVIAFYYPAWQGFRKKILRTKSACVYLRQLQNKILVLHIKSFLLYTQTKLVYGIIETWTLFLLCLPWFVFKHLLTRNSLAAGWLKQETKIALV